ncbi:MAG: CinA family protein [Pseudomonadota bacterium]
MAGSDDARAHGVSDGDHLESLARHLLALCRKRQLMLATAESCTGGLIAACLTDIPGSSAMLDRGFVTYSNEAKTEMLGVPAALIAQHGAVSEPVARAMVKGALTRSRADFGVSVTGIAGPGGGSAEKPEGLVHFAWATQSGDIRHERVAFGPIGRDKVRAATVQHAIEGLCDMGKVA